MAVFCATVTVRNERNGQPLLKPHSSAIVPLCSFASKSILPKLHSLPDMRLLVIEPPRNPVVYTRHKIRILNNIRHFLAFFGLLTDKQTYHSRSVQLSREYAETAPVLYGHSLTSIVLPLDLRDSLDDVLQSLFQHYGLCSIEFTSPTAFCSAHVHASLLASYVCPSLQSLQSLRKIVVPEALICAELLNAFSTLLNLAEIRIKPSAVGQGGLQFVELILHYNYSSQHFPALRYLHVGLQRIHVLELPQLCVRFPGVRIS